LRRSPWKHITGVLLAPDRIITSTVVVTPLGVRPAGTAEEPIAGGELGAALQQLRTAGHLRGRLVFGVDARRSYAITCKLSAEEAEQKPAELLASRLGLLHDALVAGIEEVKLPSGMHACMAAVPRDVTSAVLESLGKKPGSVRMYPLTWALYQFAARLAGRPRKWRTEVRVLRDADGGVAILAHGGFPVASRLFDMLDDRDVSSVGLAVLGLLTHAREELGLRSVDGVMLHMEDPEEGLVETCEAFTGLKTVMAKSAGCDAPSSALALAHAGARMKQDAVDLFAALRPPPGVLHRLPVRSAAVLGIAGVVLGWLLTDAAAGIESEALKLEKQTAGNLKHAHVQLADLRKVHVKLKTEVQIAQSFITNRLRWSDILRELPGVLPPTVTLIDFDGRDQVQYPSTKKKKKEGAANKEQDDGGGGEAQLSTKGRQLTIACEVELSAADSSPPEVEQLVASIQASPVFQAVLPRITGANVRLLPAVKGLSARITVYCMPPGAPGK